jgi:hypothetical protein
MLLLLCEQTVAALPKSARRVLQTLALASIDMQSRRGARRNVGCLSHLDKAPQTTYPRASKQLGVGAAT